MGLRERVEQVAPSGGQGFDNGLFRLIREHLDPELRARHGPVQIDEPRVSRLVQATGPGEPVDVAAFTAEQRRLRGGGEPPR
jgi:hypothetical protein